MSTEIKLIVTLQADWDGQELTGEDLERGAIEAVQTAIELAEENGFSHYLANDVSFGFVGIEAMPPDDELTRMDSEERAELIRQLKKFSPPDDEEERVAHKWEK